MQPILGTSGTLGTYIGNTYIVAELASFGTVYTKYQPYFHYLLSCGDPQKSQIVQYESLAMCCDKVLLYCSLSYCTVIEVLIKQSFLCFMGMNENSSPGSFVLFWCTCGCTCVETPEVVVLSPLRILSFSGSQFEGKMLGHYCCTSLLP